MLMKIFLLVLLLVSLQCTLIYSQQKHKQLHQHSNLLVQPNRGFGFNYTSASSGNFFKLNPYTSITNITGKSFNGADFNYFNELYALDGLNPGVSVLYKIDTLNGS